MRADPRRSRQRPAVRLQPERGHAVAPLAEHEHVAPAHARPAAHDEPPRVVETVRLDDVVRRAVERASRRGDHELLVDLAPWELDGDATALERAVLNVLDNAVKFSPPGATVGLRLADGTLTVEDTGPGIAEQDRSRVFDRFWRSERARGMPGSGLGLAIVADTVAQHGGAVTASTGPGGGALLTLSFPGRPPDAGQPDPWG